MAKKSPFKFVIMLYSVVLLLIVFKGMSGAQTCIRHSDCDDGNMCTHDWCNMDHLPHYCMHSNLNGVFCDDELYCNGTDTCSEGTCSAHAENPCPAGTICDEDNDTCIEPQPSTTTSIETSTTTSALSTTTTTSIVVTTTSSISTTSTTSVSLLWPMAYDEMWGINKDKNLLLLRLFRDEILVNTDVGREFIYILYDNSLEIGLLLLLDPFLNKHANEVIDELLFYIGSLLYQEEMEISQDVINCVESLMIHMESKASPKLGYAIKQLRSYIENKDKFEQLGITIIE